VNIERLSAPGLDATSGVSFGGRTFGPSTTTGTLSGAPATETVTPLLGTYSISLPAGSAALVTR
jgi:hypothetical protein